MPDTPKTDDRVTIDLSKTIPTSKQRSYQNGMFFSTIKASDQQLDAGDIIFFLNMKDVIQIDDGKKIDLHKKTAEFNSVINNADYRIGDVLKGYINTTNGHELVEKYTNTVNVDEEAYSVKINMSGRIQWMTITKLENINSAVGASNIRFIIGDNVLASTRATNWDVINEIYDVSIDNAKIGTLHRDKVGHTVHFERSNMVLPEMLDFYDKESDTSDTDVTINGLLHPAIWNSTFGSQNAFRYTINLPIYSSNPANYFSNNFASMPATMRCFTFLYFFLFPPTNKNNVSAEVLERYAQYFHPGASQDAMPNSPAIKKLHRAELMKYYHIYHVDSSETRTMNFNMLDYTPMVFDAAGNKLNHHAVCTIKDNVSGNVYLLIPRFILQTGSARVPFDFTPKHIIWRAKSILIENENTIPDEYTLKPVIASDGSIEESVLECFALTKLTEDNANKCKEFFKNTFYFQNNQSHIFTDSKDVVVAIKDNTTATVYPLPQGSMFSIVTAKVPAGRVVSNNQSQSRLVFRMRWENGNPLNIEDGDDTGPLTQKIKEKPQQVFLMKIGYELKDGESFIFIPSNSLKDHYCNLDNTPSSTSGSIKSYPWNGRSGIDYAFFGFNYGPKLISGDTPNNTLSLANGRLFPNGLAEETYKSESGNTKILEIIPRHNNRRSIWFKFKPKTTTFDISNFTIDDYNMLEGVQIIDQFKRNGEGSYMIFNNDGQLVIAVANKTGSETTPKHIPLGNSNSLDVNSWYYLVYEYPAEGYLDNENKSSYLDNADNDVNIGGVGIRPGTSPINTYTTIKKLSESAYFTEIDGFFDDAKNFQSRYDNTHKTLISDIEAITVKDEKPVSERTDIYLFDRTTLGSMINENEPYYTFQSNDGSNAKGDNYNLFIGGDEGNTITKYSSQIKIIEDAYNPTEGKIAKSINGYTNSKAIKDQPK